MLRRVGPSLGSTPWIGAVIGVAITVVTIGWTEVAVDSFREHGAYWGNSKFAAADSWGITVPSISGLVLLFITMVGTIRRVRRNGCTFARWWWIPFLFLPIAIWLVIALAMTEMKIMP
jgi:hypothetical protein